MRFVYDISVTMPQWKKSREKFRLRREDNIKLTIVEIACDGVINCFRTFGFHQIMELPGPPIKSPTIRESCTHLRSSYHRHICTTEEEI
jgi:hypothetical protein